MDELERSCPGYPRCHGFQSWCPVCGPVDHVCDDPNCDTHRRDTDVLYDIEDVEKQLRRRAKEVKEIEAEILQFEQNPRNRPGRPGSIEEKDRERRIRLSSQIFNYQNEESQLRVLEEELRELQHGKDDGMKPILVRRTEGWRLKKKKSC